MKPTNKDTVTLQDTDDLDEIVLNSAAQAKGADLAREELQETVQMTAWDNESNVLGQRGSIRPVDSDETIAEDLANAGDEEAEREQREAQSSSAK